MNLAVKNTMLFVIVFALILGTGVFQSWNVALGILNMGLFLKAGATFVTGLTGVENAMTIKLVMETETTSTNLPTKGNTAALASVATM